MSRVPRASETKIYTPDGPLDQLRSRAFSVTRTMVREAIISRELTWRLLVRDFSVRYRQSLLGFAWAFLMPLITVGVFVAMNNSGVLAVGDTGMPYPLFALIGVSVWSLFSVGLTACTNALINAGNMVLKINFPKVSLVFAAAGQGVIDFVIRIILIGLAFAWFQIVPDPGGVVLALLAVIPLVLLMVGLGFVFSLVAGVLRDLVHALNLGLMGAMLLTPVLYPLEPETLLGKLNFWNPFYYLICLPRNLLLRSADGLLPGYAWSCLFSLVVFWSGWRLFHLAQPKIAERI